MPQNKPKVSIIVPVYNVEKYLDRCMQTVMNQTLKDIEIILVDDLSPDNSPALCDEYAKKDARVKVVHKTKNEGLGFARNSGLEVATGEYVAFCDSDDWVDLRMYETLYDICKAECLDAVYAEFNVEYYPGFHVIPQPEKVYQGKDELNDLILDIYGSEPEYNSDVKYQVSSCKALYRLSLMNEKNIRFHSERELISEDMIFNLDFLMAATKVKTIPDQMYYYWLNPNSLTHVYVPNLWKRLVHFDKYLMTTAETHPDKDNVKMRIYRTTLLHLRRAIGHEIRYNKDKSEASKNIKSILDDILVKEIFKVYPLHKMPKRHYAFYKTLSFGNLFLIRTMYKYFRK